MTPVGLVYKRDLHTKPPDRIELQRGFRVTVVCSTPFCRVLYNLGSYESQFGNQTRSYHLASNHRGNNRGVHDQRARANRRAFRTQQPSNIITTQTKLSPGGVAVLADGSVLITDTFNHRVLLVGVSDDFEKKLHMLVQRGTTAVTEGDKEGYESALKLFMAPVLNTLRCVNKKCAKAGALTEEERTSGVVVDAPMERAVWALLSSAVNYDVPNVGAFVSRYLPRSLMRLRARIALENITGASKEGTEQKAP